jgi:hypothetical protein
MVTAVTGQHIFIAPEMVRPLFRLGCDTLEIAKILHYPEHQIERWLHAELHPESVVREVQ